MALLQSIGLGTLPDTEKNSLLKHIYDTLEMRVGMRLADQMTNEQLDEFERYYENKDDAGAFKWLETNFPNYKDIVQEEFDKLKNEVAQSAPQILSSSQAQASNPQQPVAEVPQAAHQPMQPPIASQPQAQQPFDNPTPPPAPVDPGQFVDPQNPQYPTQQPPAGPPPQV